MDAKQVEYITQLVVEALSKAENARDPNGIPIAVSARHAHLTQGQVEILFGAGYQLTKKKELMGGQYACNESITIVSTSMKTIEKVRIIGPTRKAAQVEISATDALKLGIRPAPPVRDSNDVIGSSPLILVGPKGSVCLAEGCILAARHIHMSPEDAKFFGVEDGQFVSVKAQGIRGATYDVVKIRVHPSYTLEMHIDTDEANAAQIKSGDTVTLIRN